MPDRAAGEALFLPDTEIAGKVGLCERKWRAVATVLEREGLPLRCPLFGNRRYWPAVRAFLDGRYMLGAHSAGRGREPPAIRERW